MGGWVLSLILVLVGLAVVAIINLKHRQAARGRETSGEANVIYIRPDDRDPALHQSDFVLPVNLVSRVMASYVALLIAMIGTGLLGFQLASWFGSGVWPALSMLDGMAGVLSAEWVAVPQRLVALHGLMNWTPIGAVLLAGALGCIIILFHEVE